jgi:N-acetylglucosaminyl-diphospho-decaprenol L-rhamnosyltransferase
VAIESTGERVREVGWVQSSAALVRREAAEQVGWLDPDFFVYSDETDFCKRLRDAGWRILFVPAARAVHHNQLSTDRAAMARRIVEFHRNRDLYFRKHGLGLTRLVWKLCWTWAYLARAAAAAVVPGHEARRYLLHARQELFPRTGEGVRDAAEARNRALANNVPAGHGAR